MKRFFLFLFLSLTGCSWFISDDDVPDISTVPVSTEELRGGWKITKSNVLWDLTSFGKNVNSIYDFKSKIKSKIKDETSDVSFYFANDTLFFRIWHGRNGTDSVPNVRQSNYSLHNSWDEAAPDDTEKGFYLTFDNENVLKFYAKCIFVKRDPDNEGGMIFYMQRGEVIEMLEEDGSIPGNYISLIKSNINSAEVDLYAERDTIPLYHEIDKSILAY